MALGVRAGDEGTLPYVKSRGQMLTFSQPLAVLVEVIALTLFAEASSDDDLQVIGELYAGEQRPERTGWNEITRSKNAPQPYPPETDSWSLDDTKLWTGISSFRDRRCGKTLFNLFTKATFPKRLTVGVVQQNLEGDEDCLETYCRLMDEKEGGAGCPFRDNIRVLAVDANEAQGPCWARHLQSYLLADEEFCMQVDSHMDFVDGWDMAMMEEWHETHNEYGVLSTYVQDFQDLGVNVGQHWQVAHLCEVEFRAGLPRNVQARGIREMSEPKMTTTWGAGYSFSKCHAERRVPYDPALNMIFDGEEFSKMVRLWTNGYDVYSPRRSHVVHDYNHLESSRANSWRSNPMAKGERENRKRLANQQLWNLMEMPGYDEDGKREVQGGPWGLGDLRSLDEFIEFTGVDLRSLGHVGVSGNRCGSGVEWVPYELGDSHADGKAGDGGGTGARDDEAFVSWRRRKGVDPIVVGPHWAEVKRKLGAAGVDVWWDPRPAEDHARDEAHEPEARAAPIIMGDSGDREGGGDGSDRNDQGKVGVRGGGAAPENTGEEVSGIPSTEGTGGKSWVYVLIEFSLACGACAWCVGRTRRRRRAGDQRRVAEWSYNAFSSGALSPLAGGKITAAFGSAGSMPKKRHQV